ncbi:hypothetical protein RhiirC2_715881 [Rhizophagus irregularis]|uniref:Uncharacterized protein n=1 Tax=Rhizophagus irregularis TaxID=588596 RepID=A0A2N1MTQ5_9GLOM|nr:hypothetical protein RhiirC2_715881 [Rhizophagus irregularis]
MAKAVHEAAVSYIQDCFNEPNNGVKVSPIEGNPHARIIGEIANTQSITALNTKCEAWMHKTYVRCVLGIKLFPKQAIRGSCSSGNVGSVLATLATAGVHVTEWDFGTIQYNNNTPTPTSCNALNNPAFQILIPIIDAFYDPPTIAVTYETLMQLITQSMQRLLKNTAIEPAPGRFIFDSNSPANTS